LRRQRSALACHGAPPMINGIPRGMHIAPLASSFTRHGRFLLPHERTTERGQRNYLVHGRCKTSAGRSKSKGAYGYARELRLKSDHSFNVVWITERHYRALWLVRDEMNHTGMLCRASAGAHAGRVHTKQRVHRVHLLGNSGLQRRRKPRRSGSIIAIHRRYMAGFYARPRSASASRSAGRATYPMLRIVASQPEKFQLDSPLNEQQRTRWSPSSIVVRA
jgi:hypothetical protein